MLLRCCVGCKLKYEMNVLLADGAPGFRLLYVKRAKCIMNVKYELISSVYHVKSDQRIGPSRIGPSRIKAIRIKTLTNFYRILMYPYKHFTRFFLIIKSHKSGYIA